MHKPVIIVASKYSEAGGAMYRIFFPLMAALALAACAGGSSTTPPESNPLSQSSAVSVSMPGFVTTADTTLRWRSDLIWVDDPEGKYERTADLLQQILQREFERKGYRFVGPTEEATYDVLAVALLGELEGREEIEQIFRLYPSLTANSGGYTKGNVLVAIAPAGTKTIVWRGALEAFTDPGMQPVEVRRQRMEWAAQQLLRSIPSV
jgi:hypothetical protein